MSARADLRLFARLLPALRPEAWLWALTFTAAPISALASVAQPWLLARCVDGPIPSGDLPGLARLSGFYLGAVVLGFIGESVYTIAASVAATRGIARLRMAVIAHTLGLGQSTYDVEPAGKLLTRATSDVEALGETLTAGAFTLVLDGLVVAFVFAGMVAMDPWLTSLLILVLPPLGLLLEVLRRKLRELFGVIRTSLSDLQAYGAERIFAIGALQLLADERRAAAGFSERLDRYRDANIRTNVWDALMFALVDGVTSITIAMMLMYAAGGALEGVATAGVLAAFIDSVGRLFTPIRELSGKLTIVQRAASALEKIFGLLDLDDRVPGTSELVAPAPDQISANDLTFSYRGGPPVLNGVDLELRRGQVVALVGRTGSGKTTVGKLLTKVYGGYSGSFTIDGRELDTLAPAAVRRAIGTVAQDVALFPGSVRFNLSLGRDVDDETLLRAVGLARATSVIERLGGLDAPLVEQAVSVGEAQLLALARTLVFDAPVILLDEATASIDTLTESAIQDAIADLLVGRTVLVIAHRLSTISRADKILVLAAGRVVESGNHAELLAAGGAYAALVASGRRGGASDSLTVLE